MEYVSDSLGNGCGSVFFSFAHRAVVKARVAFFSEKSEVVKAQETAAVRRWSTLLNVLRHT